MKYLKTHTSFIIILVLINTSFSVKSQIYEKKILELKTQIKSLEKTSNFSNDSLRIELLNKISVLFMYESKDSALFYTNKALANAKKLKCNDLIAVSYYNTARIYEHWNEKEKAEASFINWCSIRKEQGGNKYRWALSGMRKFYTETKQIEKLKQIEWEWMAVLDNQYDEKIQSPWNYRANPVQEYRLSLYPVLNNLLQLEEYFFAEGLLIHMFEKSEELRKIDWLSGDFLYFRADYYMAVKQDTASLTLWYKHWFASIEKYSSVGVLWATINTLSWDYPEEYLTPEMREKYEKLFKNLACKYGGIEIYSRLLLSELYYEDINTIKEIQLIFEAIQIAFELQNTKDIVLYIVKLEDFINSFSIAVQDIHNKLNKLLIEKPKIPKKSNLYKWGINTIKKLE